MRNFPTLLRKAKLKATPGRLKIVALFAQSKTPLSAQDVIEKMGKQCDQVTVYRSIYSLKEAGIIHQIDLRQNNALYEFYDLNHHHHIICTECGRLEDISNPELEKLLENITGKTKYFKEIKQHSLEFFGICKKCATKNTL